MEFDFYAPVPESELSDRMKRLKNELTKVDCSWSMIIIHQPINLYYFTGAMPDGVLTITPDDAVLWVRKNFERTKSESKFSDIRQMRSFKVIAEHYKNIPDTVYLEEKDTSLQWLKLINKYVKFENYKDISPLTQKIRSYKSEYELACMEKAGEIQSITLEQILPAFLREGVSEAELCGEMLLDLLRRGSMGTCRFEQPHGEAVGGICAFGENSFCGLSFDSPDGCKGTYNAVQAIGSSVRKLKKGDLVFADIASGVAGYHTDKTVVYFYGRLSEHESGDIIRKAYNICAEIEKKTASMLKPGAIPEELYKTAYSMVPDEFKDGFMFGKKFIGHSIGLAMDEPPALALSFKNPIEINQTFAIEPKILIDGVGMVGSENTYLVTENGGKSLTGNIISLKEII